MQTIILAAGEGKRVKPLTLSMSKAMIPIANKPTIEWIIKAVEKFSDEIILVVRKNQTDIINYFSKNKKITFAYQQKQLGTAHAIQQCEKYVEGNFFVFNGDVLSTKSEISNLMKKKPKAPLMCGFKVNDPREHGVLTLEGTHITEINEKPEKPKSNMINAGIYLFNEKIFEAIEKTKMSLRGEYEITDSIKILIEKEKVRCHELKKWEHVGLLWNLLEANKMILEEYGSMIGKGVKIRPGAHIEKPVAIGDGSILGPNCFIRKYSAIGKNCKVGNAVEIKNSIIMDNSFVSHLSYVGDSVIGRNCNVGAGTIFANLRLDDKTIGMKVNSHVVDSKRRKLGSIVGDNVKFGVNSTIMPGKKIWPSMIIPACSIVKDDIEKQPNLKTWKRIIS